jgi:hypothetical protein
MKIKHKSHTNREIDCLKMRILLIITNIDSFKSIVIENEKLWISLKDMVTG